MDYLCFASYWCQYWFDADASSHSASDTPDFILHGPRLPYVHSEFALDGAARGISREPAPWMPPWLALTYVSSGVWRDAFGDYWTDYSDEDGPCWCEVQFGPTAAPVQGPQERWDPLF